MAIMTNDIDYAQLAKETEGTEWAPDGDKPDCDFVCSKCKQKRLKKHLIDSPNWCRRCRYIFFDEYFGTNNNPGIAGIEWNEE